MSATTYETTLDVSGTAPVPLARLVRVELRTMVDTRSGFWLLLAIGLITVAGVLVFGLAADPQDRVFGNFMGFTATPQGLLLPVMGILLVTSEWSQRTAMVTFTLTPSRGKVLAAKVLAALVLGMAAIVLAVVVAALAALVFGGEDPFADLGADDLGKFGLLQLTGVLQGLAFGLLFLNSAAAIVVYFMLPTIFSIIANVWPPLAERAAWIDISSAQAPLFEPDANLTGEQWAQVAVTAMIWVGLPFVLGLWRVLRAEVK
jgi:ABC-type transport system involved in multi-copper enzyme maturation permease subunit